MPKEPIKLKRSERVIKPKPERVSFPLKRSLARTKLIKIIESSDKRGSELVDFLLARGINADVFHKLGIYYHEFGSKEKQVVDTLPFTSWDIMPKEAKKLGFSAFEVSQVIKNLYGYTTTSRIIIDLAEAGYDILDVLDVLKHYVKPEYYYLYLHMVNVFSVYDLARVLEHLGYDKNTIIKTLLLDYPEKEVKQAILILNKSKNKSSNK